jgi:undecaprenyl diphosphate synthase
MQEPTHVAIIMDGNGRWARRRGLPRVAGHAAARTAVRDENWQRPEEEVQTLMNMLEEMLVRETPELHKNNVRVNAIGRLDALYVNARRALQDAFDLTKNNSGLVLTLCLNYGSRSEIVDAVKKIIEQDRANRIDLTKFDEQDFSSNLYDPSLPEPDLMIRTGAEKRERISNFLLWQIAYTEVYFTKTLWPDFREREYKEAIESFKKRERLFGRVRP